MDSTEVCVGQKCKTSQSNEEWTAHVDESHLLTAIRRQWEAAEPASCRHCWSLVEARPRQSSEQTSNPENLHNLWRARAKLWKGWRAGEVGWWLREKRLSWGAEQVDGCGPQGSQDSVPWRATEGEDIYRDCWQATVQTPAEQSLFRTWRCNVA